MLGKNNFCKRPFLEDKDQSQDFCPEKVTHRRGQKGQKASGSVDGMIVPHDR